MRRIEGATGSETLHLFGEGNEKNWGGLIYSSQTVAVYGGRRYDIQHGVNKGDTLSPMLFMLLWNAPCGSGHHEVAMVHHEQLTTIRYADELLSYARSLPALVEMIETLSCEPDQIGQQLIAAKRCQK